MATTFFSDAFDSAGNPKSVKYHESGCWTVSASYTVAAALVINDLIKMVPVPKGARVHDVILSASDLDTGTSIELDVGDIDSTDDTDRYIDAALDDQGGKVGQVAGIARMDSPAGFRYQFTENGTIDVLVKVAPETGATTGTIQLTAFLSADDAP